MVGWNKVLIDRVWAPVCDAWTNYHIACAIWCIYACIHVCVYTHTCMLRNMARVVVLICACAKQQGSECNAERFPSHVCVCIHVYAYMWEAARERALRNGAFCACFCAYVSCVCAKQQGSNCYANNVTYTYIRTYIHVYLYTQIYGCYNADWRTLVYMYLCVCVCKYRVIYIYIYICRLEGEWQDGRPIEGFVTFPDGVRAEGVKPRDAHHLSNDMTLQALLVSLYVCVCVSMF
jgi:hypothetical protein